MIFSVTTSEQIDTPPDDEMIIATERYKNARNGTFSSWPDTITEYSFDTEMQNPFMIYFFHLLWQIQFLIYFTFGVIAGAVADWYYLKSKKTKSFF